MTQGPGFHGVNRCACHAGQAPIAVTRRDFMVGSVAALGTAAVSGFSLPAAAQTKPHRIDVHHHISPAPWVDALKKANQGSRPTLEWSVQKSLDDMDQGGVATSITSPTTPQVKFLDKDEARRVARESNDWAKKLAADHPGRFRMFGMLPLPHVDESLKEIDYALDTLKAEGICVLTSYGDKWLGDPAFAPVMDELHRRQAVVYTHPTAANCCRNLLPDIGDSIIEYGTDTTRTIASLVFSGTSQRCKDIKFIFSHAGGTMPFLTERFTNLPRQSRRFASLTPEGVLAEFKRFYYDTAQASHPMAMASLTKLVAVSQIVYGTDYPFRTAADHVKGLQAIFNADELKAIDRENALRLMPQLRSA